jgi:hypothetical protein
MARVKFLLLFFLGLACWPALPAFSQDANPLPNAPVPAHASETKTFRPSRWYGVVDPGERVPPLPPKDKIVFWLHEEITPVSLVPSFTSAGYAQLRNGDPQYGSDSAGFGERLGAAALREASMRFFSDSLLPTVLRTDPRYYRMGSGRFGTRAGYALERLFLTQNDSGHQVVNYSDVVGRLGASGLAMTYYPQPSVSASVVFKTWGTSLAGAEANNLFLEFWPDIRDAVFHHNRRSRPGQKAIDAATKDSDQK